MTVFSLKSFSEDTKIVFIYLLFLFILLTSFGHSHQHKCFLVSLCACFSFFFCISAISPSLFCSRFLLSFIQPHRSSVTSWQCCRSALKSRRKRCSMFVRAPPRGSISSWKSGGQERHSCSRPCWSCGRRHRSWIRLRVTYCSSKKRGLPYRKRWGTYFLPVHSQVGVSEGLLTHTVNGP